VHPLHGIQFRVQIIITFPTAHLRHPHGILIMHIQIRIPSVAFLPEPPIITVFRHIVQVVVYGVIRHRNTHLLLAHQEDLAPLLMGYILMELQQHQPFWIGLHITQ